MGALAAAAVSAGLDAASSAVTSAINNRRKYDYWVKQQDHLEQMQIAAEKRQMEYNKELQDYVFAKNLEQWHRENRYNSPSAQMARYRAAGLNPNLIYGQSNTAGASPELSIGEVGTGQAQNASPLDVEGISLDPATWQRIVNETKLADSQKENIDADTEKTKADTENIEEDTRGKKISNEFAVDVNPIKLEQAAQDLDKTKKETDFISSKIANTDLDSELKRHEIELKKLDEAIKKVDADHAEELMQLRIKRENVAISFANHQIALMAKQIASYDAELTAKLALQAAETLNRTAFSNLADSRTAYQDYVNKMNDILLDPTTDTDTSTYWSALFLKNLSETSFLDVIKEVRNWVKGSFNDNDSPAVTPSDSHSDSDDNPLHDNPRSDDSNAVPMPQWMKDKWNIK